MFLTSIRYALAGITLACMASAFADSSDDRLNDVERRLDKLETNINQILEILTKKQSAPQSKPSLASIKQSEPQIKYKKGWRMELYLNKDVTKKNLPFGPEGINLGAKFYSEVPHFNFGAIKDDPNLDGYEQERYGIMWSGKLRIHEEGPHIFSLELNNIGGGQNGNGPCVSSFSLENQTLLKVKGDFEYRKKGLFGSNMAEQKLTPAVYDAQVWLICYISANSYSFTMRNNGAVDAVLKIRAPSRKIVQEIPPDDMFSAYSVN